MREYSKTEAEGYLGQTMIVDSYAFLDFLNRPFFWFALLYQFPSFLVSGSPRDI